MLIFDFKAIGKKLQTIHKRTGMTQSEVAEAAGLSDRTYADITPTVIYRRILRRINFHLKGGRMSCSECYSD